MILTTCAACAAPLAHTAPRCVRCSTRYCNNHNTLIAALNYAASLVQLKHFKEVKSLLRKSIPVAQRVLGKNHEDTLRLKKIYARSLYEDTSATLDDLDEALTTLYEVLMTARRVLGGAHPLTTGIEESLRVACATSRAYRRACEASLGGGA